MGLYVYENPKTKEQIEVYQGMNDPHEYTDDKGVKWDRIFFPPNWAIDSIVKDPFNRREFAEKGANKKATLGNWYDESAELSEKRAQKYGIDPIREKYYEDYSKNRKGKKHYMQQQEKVRREMGEKGVIIENFKSRAEYNKERKKNERTLKKLGLIEK